eukprot:4252316-Pleurochrysis_carterae.AAC.1
MRGPVPAVAHASARRPSACALLCPPETGPPVAAAHQNRHAAPGPAKSPRPPSFACHPFRPPLARRPPCQIPAVPFWHQQALQRFIAATLQLKPGTKTGARSFTAPTTAATSPQQ